MINNHAVVVGSAGMLGRDLLTALGSRSMHITGLSREVLDVTDLQSCERILHDLRPSIVYNCAGFTRVDDSEQLQQHAMLVNGQGAGNVARAASAVGAKCVYISTDYVFDGEKGEPYLESDLPRPINAYGFSKLEGEYRTMEEDPRNVVVRTSWLYGAHGRNFVLTMLKHAARNHPVRVVSDQLGCPTSTGVLSALLAGMVESEHTGILHGSGSGSCTWYEFARAIYQDTERNPIMLCP